MNKYTEILMKNSFAGHQAYFDCNATTPVLPFAANAAVEAMRILYGNPSSLHLVGIQAKNILETTRKRAADAVGADADQITFTSGATEAIQTSVFSALNAVKTESGPKGKKILYCATEHKAVPQAIHHWVKILGLDLEILAVPVDRHGQIEAEALRKDLPEAALLCTMAVNNETGVIQNLSIIETALIETASPALWLVDCVQGLGKIPLDLKSRRVNYAAFSGHKLYAPKGIGFLYVKPKSPLTPLIVGGGQEKGLRSGTENLPGVAALGAVLERLLHSPSALGTNGSSEHSDHFEFQSHSKQVEFRDRLSAELKRAFPKIQFNTPFETSVPTTINFSVPGFSSSELLEVFDSGGLRLSAGSACNSASVEPSHVLTAMGIDFARSSSALRLSFGPATAEREIARGCRIIRESALALKSTCLLDVPGGFGAPETLRDGVIQFRTGATNSWIIAQRDRRSCIIIDPCETVAERMEHYIRCQGLQILGILDTHSHADHESIRPVLLKLLADRMVSEKPSLPGGQLDQLGWPASGTPSLMSTRLQNGQQVPALLIDSNTDGNLILARLATPGHTQDSHAFLYGIEKSGALLAENVAFVFSGDTILSGGLGRTNFAASDPGALFQSLQLLHSVLSQTTLICPAHDYSQSFATSLKIEAGTNPLLNLAIQPSTPLSLQLFLERKLQIDQDLARLEENFDGIVCGVTSVEKDCVNQEIALSQEEIKARIQALQVSAEKIPLLVIDVREPQEHALFHQWKVVGFETPPKNVPLSRFVNFIGELISQPAGMESAVILVCRTGARSLQAAKALRKLGFNRTWSLKGGIALSNTH